MAQASILLLEDDPGIRDLLADLFTGEGYAVRACASFDEVLRVRDGSSAVLAVLDAWGDSQAFLNDVERAEIQEMALAIPSIMLTGRLWAETTPADELGLLGLIRKPFDLEDLVDFVKASIDSLVRDSVEARSHARQLRQQIQAVRETLRDVSERLGSAADRTMQNPPSI